jgi:hypothetical protein
MGSDDIYNELAKSADWLGRLQLYTKGKAINKGLIRPGHYGVPDGDDDIIDLGDSIDILPLARRPKAIDMSDKDAIITCYNPESEEFRRIVKQSSEPESHCMFGPSFLVIERSTGRFLEYYCGTKSARQESKKLFPYLPLTAADIAASEDKDRQPHGPLPATLKVKLAEARSFSWHVPQVVKCSTPFAQIPAFEVIKAEVAKFISAKDSAAEKVDASSSNRRAR